MLSSHVVGGRYVTGCSVRAAETLLPRGRLRRNRFVMPDVLEIRVWEGATATASYYITTTCRLHNSSSPIFLHPHQYNPRQSLLLLCHSFQASSITSIVSQISRTSSFTRSFQDHAPNRHCPLQLHSNVPRCVDNQSSVVDLLEHCIIPPSF